MNLKKDWKTIYQQEVQPCDEDEVTSTSFS